MTNPVTTDTTAVHEAISTLLDLCAHEDNATVNFSIEKNDDGTLEVTDTSIILPDGTKIPTDVDETIRNETPRRRRNEKP